ncbi:MAG: group II intron reverse transcriptase/maturase, partial [bacterium]|nr:group II intron reverse transcriptase/maturase [bacterium]
AVATSRLLEEVASLPNLAAALLHVARNKGACGVDGQSVEEAMEAAPSLLPHLSDALLTGLYRPGDVRRVWIPKPGGGQRGLGIPNVVDRLVQQAVHQVLEPVFEPGFHDSSYGFRRHRGAPTAIAEACEYVNEGNTWVVGVDLSKFFDRVNHQRLLSRMAQKVEDGRLLALVHRMLKAKVVMPNGTRVSTTEGTPQGGPLSPLLSNIVLDELDWELDRRGLRFVRYADDFNVYVRSERAARRVMASLSRFIEGRLRLLVNADKSEVARPEQVHLLGFSLRKRPVDEGVEVHLSKRSKERLDTKIRTLTPRNWGRSLKECLQEVSIYVRGWVGYFRLCTEEGAKLFQRYDAHIRRRVRAIVVKQKKRARNLYRHLRASGVSERGAADAAWCSKSPWKRSIRFGLQNAYPNAWFHARMDSLWLGWCRFKPPPKPREASTGQLALPGLEMPG